VVLEVASLKQGWLFAIRLPYQTPATFGLRQSPQACPLAWTMRGNERIHSPRLAHVQELRRDRYYRLRLRQDDRCSACLVVKHLDATNGDARCCIWV
jgi:hypothetical protein